VKPRTYMNRSGQAAREIAVAEDLTPEQILVVCDDTSIPFSQLRVRSRGSHGGHNGMLAALGELHSDRFEWAWAATN
ncbi:MAG: aminoacyl-tRNA hydrolase, partial [Chloroflexota bacterium]